jgi:hypothetical protein
MDEQFGAVERERATGELDAIARLARDIAARASDPEQAAKLLDVALRFHLKADDVREHWPEYTAAQQRRMAKGFSGGRADLVGTLRRIGVLRGPRGGGQPGTARVRRHGRAREHRARSACRSSRGSPRLADPDPSPADLEASCRRAAG